MVEALIELAIAYTLIGLSDPFFRWLNRRAGKDD